MANARTLDKRRKSIRSIRKITRTMELIATARFKRPWIGPRPQRRTRNGSTAAGRRPGSKRPGGEPPAAGTTSRDQQRAILLVLTANRGMCGGYNSGVLRPAIQQYQQAGWRVRQRWNSKSSGKRGIAH